MNTKVDSFGPRFLTALAALALAACPAAQALLTVTNVRAAQQSGKKLVDIDYDVTGTTTPVTVSLQISADGGTTWAVPATTMTGAIGSNITPAASLRITWDAGADWNQRQSTLMVFQITVIASSDFTLIPAGSFTMGDALDKDANAPSHPVNVSAFCMRKWEISKSQWAEVRAWSRENGYQDIAAGAGKAATHPIENVTWYDVVKWCNALSEKEGLTPCYYTDPAQTTATVYRTGKTDIANTMVNWSANGYRLPTEAEWEKAARDGLSGQRFPWGDTITHSLANYYVALSSDGKKNLYSYDLSTTSLWHPTYKTVTTPYTAPVGSFAANGYGLFDMAGNVREWCWDRYNDAYYATSPATDPHGPDTGTNRMLRGGDWGSTANSNRVAYRYSGGVPGTKSNRFGFRTVNTHIITATSSNITVDTRQWLLTTSALSNGTINGVASGGIYLADTTATLTAVPTPGYVFTGWTGAATGTTNPLSLLMNADKTLGATFAKDLADSDGDGLTNFDELVIFGTDPHSSDPPLMTLAPGTGSSFTLSFLARAASAGLTRKYDVQWSSTLAPGSWLGVTGQTNIVGDNTTHEVPLTIDAARMFYRLSVRVE